MIDEKEYRMVRIFKACGNGIRWEILRRLADEPQSVSQLSKDLDRDDSTISRYLGQLRKLDLVIGQNNGRKRVYRVKREDILDKLLELRPLVRRDQSPPSELEST